jgi:hypothetical protein
MSERLNLVLHCGAAAVEPHQLDEVQLPPIKRNSDGHVTFQPVSHLTVRNRIRESVSDLLTADDVVHWGDVIRDEAQGMTNDGARAFGMMEVRPQGGDRPDDKRGLMIGWRNSHDQSFASAVAMGSRTFICDNLAWSGEIQVSRRHTRHIIRDLPEVISRAVGQLLQASQRQEEFYQRMEGHHVGRVRVNDTLVEAMRSKAIANASIPKVLKEYESKKHCEMHGVDTAWSLFNAFTEIAKNDPVTTSMKRTQRLHGVFGKLVGVAS